MVWDTDLGNYKSVCISNNLPVEGGIHAAAITAIRASATARPHLVPSWETKLFLSNPTHKKHPAQQFDALSAASGLGPSVQLYLPGEGQQRPPPQS
jgi:hypothetical protein